MTGSAAPQTTYVPIPTFSDVASLLDWYEGSIDALDDHLASVVGEAAIATEEARVAIDGQTAQLQLWWVDTGSRISSELLWDCANVQASDGKNLELIAEAMKRWDEDCFDPEPRHRVVRRRPISEVPLFQYHPQRYVALNPIGEYAAKIGARSQGRGFTQTVVQGMLERAVLAQREYLPKTRLRYSQEADPRAFSKQASLGCFAADFHHFGKQIFDFPSSMVRMFGRTDVDGIPLDLIHLPHESQYLYFGPQDELQLKSGWKPDGAYVASMGPQEKRVIQFALTFAPADAAEYEPFLENPEPMYIQAVAQERLSIGVGEAVDLELSDKIAELRRQISEGMSLKEEDLNRVRVLGAEAGLNIVDETSKNAAHELAHLDELHTCWQSMLRLVVNALAYLSSYKEDWRHREIAEVAPASVVASIPTNPRKLYKRNSTLAQLGYNAVHLCGVNFASSEGSKDVSPDEASEQDAYTWVRGHWRNQAHGPLRSLRRLQWTMPFRRRIRSAEYGEASMGHIYLVSDTQPQPEP